MSKTTKFLTAALIVYLILSISAFAVGRKTRYEAEKERADAERFAQMVVGERDNALALYEQYKTQFQEASIEIAALKAEKQRLAEQNERLEAENRRMEEEKEELVRAAEETSFALDEVVYETGWTSLGSFRITHYCNCAKCCGKWAGGPTASGAYPSAGRTIAVDPSVIPLGSEVRINGHVYMAEDTGVSGAAIDIFVNDHQEAIQKGMYYTEVEIFRT